mmetsp:Transcript_19402/g.44425  ORF Transcript_19402/g.44425 Transcript_19402/m.44425 type:complete len:200 (+) Transcript_19402:69-668(+)
MLLVPCSYRPQLASNQVANSAPQVRGCIGALPFCFPEIFKEQTKWFAFPSLIALTRAIHVYPSKDRVQDTSRCVNLIYRSLKRVSLGNLGRPFERVFIIDPSRIHSIHVDSFLGKIFATGPCHHVYCCLGHVCVRVIGSLVTVKLPFHCRDIDDIAIRSILRCFHEWLESRIQHERSNCVDKHAFDHLRGTNTVHLQQP